MADLVSWLLGDKGGRNWRPARESNPSRPADNGLASADASQAKGELVHDRGLEPRTSDLKGRRSTDGASRVWNSRALGRPGGVEPPGARIKSPLPNRLVAAAPRAGRPARQSRCVRGTRFPRAKRRCP